MENPFTRNREEVDSGHETKLLSEVGRAKVDEWLVGINATRDGLFNMFFIKTTGELGIIVTPENANEVEADIRGHFAEAYPEIAVVPEGIEA